MQPVPESDISFKELRSLLEMIESLVSRSEVSDGDFRLVEEAIGDLIANLRPELMSRGPKISKDCSSEDCPDPRCEGVSNILRD